MLSTGLSPTAMKQAKPQRWQAGLINMRRLWDGPSLDAGMRRRMAEHTLRWVGVPALGLCGFVVIMLLAETGLSQPTRLVPPAVFALPCIWVWRLRWAERWLEAATVFCGAALAATSVSVLLHGVRAPGYGVGVLVLMMIVVLYGLRWGVLAAVGFIGVGGLHLLLHAHGLAMDIPQPSAALVYIIQAAVFLLTLTLVGGPQLLLTDALHAARLQQRAAEEAHAGRERSELAFHAVFDQASVGLALLTPDGDIVQLNTRAARLLGQAELELVGRQLTAAGRFSAMQQAQLRLAVENAALGHASQHELSLTQGGVAAMYQVALSPFLDGGGQVRRVLVELVDVSDLVETRSMLAQARRLEALGKLSGGVAHDLNNMFAAILGGCELVRIARGDARRIEDHVKLIQTSVQRAATLTKQLLAFGRKDRWNGEQLDVNRLMYEVSRLFSRTLHKNIQVLLMPSAEPSYVRGDPAALEHALLNLVLNAQAAMPNGGSLTLACRRSVLEPSHCASLNGQIAPGPSVILSVEDTGTGMSREVREHMFEPFFTTKAPGEGTGLGLAAVHGTMRAHRGAIAVNSQLGVGTRIELYLPALDAGVGEVAPEQVERGGVPAALKAHVLFADDEALARSAITSLLAAAGCEVQALPDGAAILDTLRNGATPDVIVTDLAMPGLCGVDLVQAIEALRPGCPLLLITGFGGDEVALALPDRSSRLLLRKPFAGADLLRSLTELLAVGQKRQLSGLAARGA